MPLDLAAIRERVEKAQANGWSSESTAPLADAIDLLAEVTRLREQLGPPCQRCEVGRAEKAGCDLGDGCASPVKPYQDEVARLRAEAAKMRLKLQSVAVGNEYRACCECGSDYERPHKPSCSIGLLVGGAT